MFFKLYLYNVFNIKTIMCSCLTVAYEHLLRTSWSVLIPSIKYMRILHSWFRAS